MSENLAIWSAVERTDPNFTKDFKRGGGFNGTATNPTYLARKATEMFGPCGIGWGVDIEQDRYDTGGPLGDDRGTLAVVHVVQICFWYMHGEKRGEIRAFGQTDFVSKNKWGIVTDEEAPKKSLTDAMTKAMSLLGFSADIHMGRYDDSKYVAEVRREHAPKSDDKPSAPKADDQPDPQAFAARVVEAIKNADDGEKLAKWWAANSAKLDKLKAMSVSLFEHVETQYQNRLGVLAQEPPKETADDKECPF